MQIEVSSFGRYPYGRDISLYTLSNKNGMKVSVSDLGAVIVKIIVPDKAGNFSDVALGFDRGEDYLKNPSFFGAVIGPNANRIKDAVFQIDGKAYQLDVNDGANNLHSHKDKGYHKRLWKASLGEDSISFELEDADGSMGFPGNKRVGVTYSLSPENELKIHYHGTSDKKTILNLTNHCYFNLDGHDSGRMDGHELWLGASHYTPADAGSIPYGDIVPVKGTPMDFTNEKRIGDEIDADFEQLKFAGGYDHNWVIDDWDGGLRHCATLKAPKSGRVMKVYTTLPGIQFYAGNFIDRQAGKGGADYGFRSGLCLETQYFPDAANKPQFPSAVFGEGREYDSVTVYRFE